MAVLTCFAQGLLRHWRSFRSLSVQPRYTTITSPTLTKASYSRASRFCGTPSFNMYANPAQNPAAARRSVGRKPVGQTVTSPGAAISPGTSSSPVSSRHDSVSSQGSGRWSATSFSPPSNQANANSATPTFISPTSTLVTSSQAKPRADSYFDLCSTCRSGMYRVDSLKTRLVSQFALSHIL